MRFAVSILAHKLTPQGVSINHHAFIVEASSSDEALGKGIRVAQRRWPVARGWTNHHVAGQSADFVLSDPETVDPEEQA